MPKSLSRMSRNYAGEFEGYRVVTWLNRNKGGAKAKCVLRVLDLLPKYRRAVAPWIAKGISGVTGPEMALLEKLGRALWAELGRWPVYLCLDADSIEWAKMPKFTYARADSAGVALLNMIRLFEQGLIHRVRRCLKCKKWFYARFRHQQFCSTRCQQSHYRSSEEWKAYRREWMRQYRRLTP